MIGFYIHLEEVRQLDNFYRVSTVTNGRTIARKGRVVKPKKD